MPNKALPLLDRTIMITRARAQAAGFAQQLENYGARVVQCPAIEIIEPESYEAVDEAIDNLYGYDWVIFTSANGVEYFVRRLAATGHDASDLDDLRVCAIGERTAEALRGAAVHVDVVPEEFKAEGVFRALETYMGGREKLQGQVFLVPRAAVARDYLPRALEEAGGRVDAVTVYRTVPPQNLDRARAEVMLAGGGVDCITFTSPSTVQNFALLFDTTDLGQLLAGVAVACIGDITAQTIANYNLRIDIQPEDFTAIALAKAIADFYSQ